mmetsp:Transcript_7160/g.16511  ORF Transcript_7160/g.16511 Transcript_7160/m.16511 type:complete len:225 (-) Transcript_7160:319-993(-)
MCLHITGQIFVLGAEQISGRSQGMLLAEPRHAARGHRGKPRALVAPEGRLGLLHGLPRQEVEDHRQVRRAFKHHPRVPGDAEEGPAAEQFGHDARGLNARGRGVQPQQRGLLGLHAFQRLGRRKAHLLQGSRRQHLQGRLRCTSDALVWILLAGRQSFHRFCIRRLGNCAKSDHGAHSHLRVRVLQEAHECRRHGRVPPWRDHGARMGQRAPHSGVWVSAALAQ